MYMNNKGISFVEALLTVVIIMLLTGSLIPINSQLNESLLISKLNLHVSQVAYNAAKQITGGEISNGFEMIERTDYRWTFDGQKLCVNYEFFEEVKMKCFTREGSI